MKMLNKKKLITNIVVTGVDNDTMTFPTVKEAAKFLDVTTVMIYRALNENLKVRGCTVKKEKEEEALNYRNLEQSS